MKKLIIVILTITTLLSSCGTGRMATDNSGAVFAGAAIGGNVGSAIGGLIGDNSGGRRGSYRGSAIGNIIGTIAGAAIANAATASRRQEESGYRIERSRPFPAPSEVQRAASGFDHLRIQNIRFIDDDRDHIIRSEENSKVIFEIMNESNQTVYNVVPVVAEATGAKRIYLSSSVMIEQIAPHEGVKYTANLYAGKRIKTGEIVIHISIADEYGQEYDRQEFSLQTQR